MPVKIGFVRWSEESQDFEIGLQPRSVYLDRSKRWDLPGGVLINSFDDTTAGRFERTTSDSSFDGVV